MYLTVIREDDGGLFIQGDRYYSNLPLDKEDKATLRLKLYEILQAKGFEIEKVDGEYLFIDHERKLVYDMIGKIGDYKCPMEDLLEELEDWGIDNALEYEPIETNYTFD